MRGVAATVVPAECAQDALAAPASRASEGAPGTIGAVLAFVDAHLHDKLPLAVLAKKAGYTPSHFQRVFRRALGVSPRAYVAARRLERAAFDLLVLDDSVLRIALAWGYSRHETFTRAFSKHFGCTPRTYRQTAGGSALLRGLQRPAQAHGEQPRVERGAAYSAVRVVTLAPFEALVHRVTGAYTALDGAAWAPVLDVAHARVEAWGAPRLLGLCHDMPEVTPAAQMRFDAGVVVPRTDARSPHPWADAVRGLTRLTVPGGLHVTCHYAGPVSGVNAAYTAMIQHVHRARRLELAGFPALEFYRGDDVAEGRAPQDFALFLPVRHAGALP